MRSIPPLFNPILAVWDVSAHFWIAPPSEGCIKGEDFLNPAKTAFKIIPLAKKSVSRSTKRVPS